MIDGHGSPFPATLHSLTAWASHLGDKHLPVTTIKSYLVGLRSAHVDMGYDDLDVFHHPVLKRVLNGIRRLRGEANTQERQPITRDILLHMLTLFDQSTLYGATMHSAFCLAFAGFLRIGEFTWNTSDVDENFSSFFLTRRSVSFYDDYLQLTLPTSKTDPFRKGVTLTISASNDAACPLRSLRHLYTCFPAKPSDPLFIPGQGQAMTRRLVTDTLRQTLKNLGYTGHYSGHSFRRGAATWARQVGLSDDEIQLLGRWKSDAYRLYIAANPSYIQQISRRLQCQGAKTMYKVG